MGPLKKQFIKYDVSPNVLTWLGFVFSAVAGFFFAKGEFGLGGWFVILAATCDVYDGQLARARGINNKSGAFLDSLLDRLGESCMFYGLAWHFRENVFWFTLLFVTFTGSQLTSYSRARAEGLGFVGARGFFQRAERMIVLSIGMCLVPVVDVYWQKGEWVLWATLWCLFLGSLETAFSRSVSIYCEILKTEKKPSRAS
jgi:CDP-diacylglycerol--glycerol-3-phosphate 3-phosphatidyltransferase